MYIVNDISRSPIFDWPFVYKLIYLGTTCTFNPYLKHFGDVVKRHLWTKKPHAFGNIVERRLWTKKSTANRYFWFPEFYEKFYFGNFMERHLWTKIHSYWCGFFVKKWRSTTFPKTNFDIWNICFGCLLRAWISRLSITGPSFLESMAEVESVKKTNLSYIFHAWLILWTSLKDQAIRTKQSTVLRVPLCAKVVSYHLAS